MALDSLGLGLTLDTTLLAKAETSLENMAKNSKLVMQNLTRGITAFNEGKIADFTQVLGHMSSALDKLSKTEVSPDFDTTGQDKFIGRMQHIMSMMEKMSKIKGAKFYDPTEVYATDKDASDILAEMGELQEYKKELAELVEITKNYDSIQRELKKTMYALRGEIPAQQKEVNSLATSYDEAKKKQEVALKAMVTQFKSFSTRERKKDPSLTDEQLMGKFAATASMQKYIEAVKKANEELAREEERLADAKEKLETMQASLRETGKEYQSNWRVKQREEEIKSSYDLIKEQEKILQSEMEFAQATEAERAAMLTERNEAEIKADQKRVREKQKEYENLRKAIQKGEKDIADLEASRATLKEAGRSTKSIDAEIKRRRDELNKLMQDELEFRSSQYWPKLQAIDEKFNSEAFIKNQKALAKLAAKESRKEVTAAIQYSTKAQTINEEREAIKRLIEARDNLSTSSRRYQKTVEDINKRILAHKDHIEAVTRVEKEQNTLSDSVINRYRKQLKALQDIDDALKELHKRQIESGTATPQDTADEQALLARRKTVLKDILDIEQQAQGQLDVIKEQHESDRARRSIEESARQHEREKQEYAKLLDELYAIEKQKKAMEAAGGGVGDVAYDKLLQQEADLQTRKAQLESQHQNDLDEIRAKHDKKRNDDEVKAFVEAQREKQRIAEETQRKIDAYNEKYGTTSKSAAEMAITSFSGAQNINQHKQAIESLQQVRARLNNADKDYYETLKKLNQEIHSHELYVRAAENESVKLTNSHRGLMDISGQLMRRLALVFSVSQMTQYFRKLVEVRGQFEKTEVALTSIVGSQEKSNKLMNQTIALAIKSPFTLQQLTGYTKQLAAYQVSYEQLHDTTKMLADVSAGLGVEMDRLILAFGQVKAANFLRATEVRQFTEAGFNILGELAKYYSELEGTMVTVGDVQERVTKRMVDFADVEQIFHRVTEAGGMFYDMQSRQAETLAGQWTNLQDRIDIMLNEIGMSGEGVLKFIVKFLASAIDNWEVLASSIKTAAVAFLIFKTYSLLAGDGIKLLAIQMGVLTKSVPKVLTLGQAFKTLSRVVSSSVTKIGASMSALLTNPIFLAIAAIVALISAGVALGRHLKQMNEALKEQASSFNEYTASLNKLSKEYNKLDKFTEKLAKLEELNSRLNERGLNLSVKIDEVDTENIDKIFTENSEILQKSYDLGLSVGNAITRGINAAQGNIFGWSTFGENLAEDAEDFAAKWNKLASYGMDAQMQAMENEIEANKDASEEALTLYEKIREGRKAERDENGRIVKYLESEYEWTMRRAMVLKEIQDLEDDSVTKNNRLARYIRKVARQEKELKHEVDNTFNKLAKEFKGVENLRQAAKDNPIEFSAAIQAEVDKQAWDEVTKWVYSQKLHAKLGIEPIIAQPQKTEEEKLAQFQEDLKEARANLKEVKDGYQNFFISEEEIKNMKFFSDGLEGIQKLYDDNKKTIEQLEGTSDAYSEEELARLNALQRELEAVAEKWNYNLNEGKDEKGTSKGVKILQKRISLLKEVNQKYLELEKTFDAVTAKEKVMEAYADTFREAFAGTGVDLDLYKVMTQVITDSKKVGEEMGTNLSEGVINKLKELEGAGTYIRSATEDVVEFTKAAEAFRPNAYLDKMANVWTIGYGTTSRAGIGVNVVKGMVIDQAKAEEWLLKTYKSKEKVLNSILDKHKDLIITQEQYNALLDAAYNGEGAAKAIEFAYGSWEHFERYLNSLKAMKQANKKAVVVDVEEIKKEWEALDTIQEKLALTLKWSGIRTGGKVSSALQDRAIKRAEMFSGDLDIANQLETVLVRIAGMDFTTTEGLIEALGQLKEIAEREGPEAKNILSQAISELEAEIGVRLKKDADKELNDEVQALFDRYELTVDLKKLNLPKDLAEQLFDVKYLDIDGLRKAVQDKASKFVGTDQYEKYKEFLEKIDEMEREFIIERTKKYSEYLTRGMNERVKLKVEELRKLKELEESKEFEPKQKEQIRKQIRLDTQKQLDKESWEQFQATDWYTMMFTDLETLGTQAIKNLSDELSTLKDSLAHLDPSEVKEIVSQMEKLQEQLIARNPFEAFREARKDIQTLGATEEDVIGQLKAYEDNERNAQKMLDMLSEIENARATGSLGQLSGETLTYFQSLRDEVLSGNKEAFNDARKTYEHILSEAQAGKKLTSEQVKMFQNYRKSLQGIADYWGEIDGKVQSIVGSAVNIMDVYGVGEAAKSIAEGVGSMSMLITQAIQFGIQMKIAGIAANSALGIIGWIAIAIQAIATIISAIANYKNAQIDEQLEKQAKLIEKQRDLYEQIEKKVESAYNVDNLRKYNAEMKRSVELEIQALEASIALEKSRKNADEDQIADWQKEITEARQRLEESTQEMKEMVGGIFDLDDFTSGFVDAWWDAMDEGMSGLDALNEHFEETMKDMVKKQALYRGAQKIMEQVMSAINADLEGDFDIDDWAEIERIAKKANVDLDAFLQGWYDMFGAMSDGAGGSLSELQKGIQGITEDTAQIIEAYLNSIRAYASEQVEYTKKIYNMFYAMTTGSINGLNVRLIP